MPIARFQLPDGRIARFEVPEGTTPDQAQKAMLDHFNQAAPVTAKENAAPVSTQNPQAGFVSSSVMKGLANIPDMFLNTPSNAYHLLQLGARGIAQLTGDEGKKQRLDQALMNAQPPSPTRRALAENVALTEPTTPGGRIADTTIQSVVGGFLGGPTNLLRNMAVSGTAGAVGGGVTEATDNPTYGLLASLAATPVIAAAANKVANIPHRFTNAGRERMEGNYLLNSTQRPEVAIQALRSAQEGVQASRPTTGMVLSEMGDNAQLGREAAMMNELQGSAPANIKARLSANAAARDAAMQEMAPTNNGALTISDRMKARIAERQQAAQNRTAKAENIAASERGKTGPTISNLQAGENIRTGLSVKEDVARQAVADQFKGVDTGNTTRIPVDMRILTQGIDDIYAKLDKVKAPEVKRAVEQVKEALDKNKPPKADDNLWVPDRIKREIESTRENFKTNMSYNELKTIASVIGDAQRSAYGKQQEMAGAALTTLKQGLYKAMDDAVEQGKVPADVAARYKTARAAKVDYVNKYGSGAAKNALIRDQNMSYQMHTENVPSAFLGGVKANADSFQRALGASADDVANQANKTASDWLATQWRQATTKTDGTLKNSWKQDSDVFIREHSAVLDMFPTLKAQMKKAVATSKSAEEVALKMDDALKKYTTKTAARFWNQPNKDAYTSFDDFVNSKNPEIDGAFLAQRAKNDPEFNQALDSAIREHLAGMKDDAARIKFVSDPSTQRMLKTMVGPDKLKQINRVMMDAARDNRLLKAKQSDRGMERPERTTSAARVAYSLLHPVYALKHGLAESAISPGRAAAGSKLDLLQQEVALNPQQASALMQSRLDNATLVDIVKAMKLNAAAQGATFPQNQGQ